MTSDRERLRALQERLGVTADGVLGPQTLTALERLERLERAARAHGDPIGDPPWLVEARRFLGTRELPGDWHNPVILEWLGRCSIGHSAASRDETPWCSAFVNGMIERVGLRGTGSAAARSWETWGEACEPRPGAVIVFPRGSNPRHGHVAFVAAHPDEDGRIAVLGGNQGNRVSVVVRRLADAVAVRWPAGVP